MLETHIPKLKSSLSAIELLGVIGSGFSGPAEIRRAAFTGAEAHRPLQIISHLLPSTFRGGLRKLQKSVISHPQFVIPSPAPTRYAVPP